MISIFALIYLFVVMVAAALLVAFVLPWAVRRAIRSRFVDVPEGRKAHDRPVPPIGGLVIIPVFMGLAPVLGLGLISHWPFYLALGLILAVGLFDDRHEISPSFKLFAQIGVSLILTVSGEATLYSLGHLFGKPDALALGVLAIPFTVTCFVFLMNAMNMIDGVDGLAGGISAVMLFWLAVGAMMSGDVTQAGFCVLLLGLVIGFLVYNMRYPGHRRATVFLGDAGSMSLGLLIAVFAVQGSQGDLAGFPPIGVAMIILVPIVDAFALFIVRIKSGRRAFTPGRDHVHHQLLDAGLTPAQVTITLMGVVAVTGGVGVLLPRLGMLGEGVMTWIWISVLLGYTFFLLYRAPRLYRRDLSGRSVQEG